MQIIETAEMGAFRLAMQDTLRQQAETILSMQARIEAMHAELQAWRERRAFWIRECQQAEAALADLRRQRLGSAA